MTGGTDANLSCLLSFYDTVKVYMGVPHALRAKLISVSRQLTVINQAASCRRTFLETDDVRWLSQPHVVTALWSVLNYSRILTAWWQRHLRRPPDRLNRWLQIIRHQATLLSHVIGYICCYVQRNFLSLLESCGKDAVAIASCFVSQNEGFAIYSDYCTNYPKYSS